MPRKSLVDLPEIREVPDTVAPVEASPWKPLVQDGADILIEELPPVVEIVEGIIAEQSKLVIGGGAKCYKTWITIHLGLSISCGLPFLGRKTNQRRVLYVNLELKSTTFKQRLQTIAKLLGATLNPATFLHLPLRGKLSTLRVDEIVSRIIRLAQDFKAEVVIIDPTYKLNVEGDENNSRDQTLFFNNLDRITTEGACTLILNDHFTKGNQSEKEPLDAIRGHSVKGGDVDAAMILRQHEVAGAFRVDIIHRELPPVEPFCICWKFPVMELRGDLDAGAMKKPKGGRNRKHDPLKLLAAIKDTSAQSTTSISAWALRAGISRQTLQSYLPKLRGQGYLSTSGDGNTARQFITTLGKEALQAWEGKI